MTVGLNKIDTKFLLQMLDGMAKEQMSEFTVTRDMLLHEIGSRTYNEHAGQKPTEPTFAERNFKCLYCAFASVSQQGLTKHTNARHVGKSEASVSEFAEVTGVVDNEDE